MPLKYAGTVLLTGVFLLMGVINLRDRAAWLEPTDGVFWTESGNALVADAVEKGGVGYRAGIREGDRLKAVSGRPISNLDQLSDQIYEAGPGTILEYALERTNATRVVNVCIGTKRLLGTKDKLRALLAFLHLVIGAFALIRGSHLPRAMHFYYVCLLSYVVYLFSYTPRLGAMDWWVYGVSVMAFFLLPAMLLHLSLRFPVDSRLRSGVIILLYLPCFFLFSTQILWLSGRLASLGLPRTAYASVLLDRIHLLYFLAGFLMAGAVLLKRRFEAREWLERQQLKWIGNGLLAGITPFGLVYGLPTLLGVRANFWMETSMLSLALIPLTFGYAIVRYRLMDVELITRRSATYGIASSLLLCFYLFFVLVLGRAFQWLAPQADFIAVLSAVLLIAFLFAPLRNKIQQRLDKLFYGERFEDRVTLRDFARTLNSELSLEPLAQSILYRISRTFQIDKAAIFLADPVLEGHFRLVRSSFGSSLLPSAAYRAEELFGTRDEEALKQVLESGSGSLHKSSPMLMAQGLCYLQDLVSHGKRIGMIALGCLPENRRFSTEDTDLLAVLAGYAAVALENAGLYESLASKALELEQMKAYIENILENVNVAVLAMDLSGRVTSCNKAFELLYQAERDHIVGRMIEQLFTPDIMVSIKKAAGCDEWESIVSPVNIFKLSWERPKGLRRMVDMSLIPMKASSGADSGILIVMDDITEKVQMEDQLLQTEKLSSIGLLAAGIAHEVNTPIAGISSYTQMLLKETPDTDRRKHILQKIEKQTFRAAEIVSGLLNFSRLSSSEFKDLDINQLIEDSLALLRHQLELNNIRVESKYDFSLPPVYGNVGKLQQVLVNLLLNARDAMPSGGELEVRTGMSESMVTVEISDTGVGIPEENIRKIFDPFFTTKSMGKGTGLGLAVTYGIIQEHGGGIFVDSAAGKGTRFKLKLPTRLH